VSPVNPMCKRKWRVGNPVTVHITLKGGPPPFEISPKADLKCNGHPKELFSEGGLVFCSNTQCDLWLKLEVTN